MLSDRMVDAIDRFRPYLQAVLTGSRESAYRDWQECYLPTQAELPLRVQTYLPSQASSQWREEKREKMEVLNGFRKYASDHVLVVGKPGSGKSTSLKRLAWEEAQCCLEREKQESSRVLQIPVFLELRSFHNSVLQLIQRSLRQWKLRLNEAEIEDLLFDGQLLLLFDGLNELPSDEAWRKVEDFRRYYADTPMIFSTRELGAGADLGIEKKLEMMPLKEPQMQQFIEKRLPGQAEALLRQVHDRLRELAETPLLLKMLCDVFAQKGQIPKNRGELFRKEFARRYEEFKPLRGRISEDSRRFAPELLQYLAFVMIQGDPHSDPCKPTPPWLTIPKTKAEQILAEFLAGGREPDRETKAKAKEWLEDLLEYHLLQVANDPNKIEFHHQLFQEYYAAEWLLLQLPTLSDEQLQYYFLNYLKWTEAIGLMLGLIDEDDFGGRGREQAIRVVKLALGIEIKPIVDLMLGTRLAGEVKPEFQEQTVKLVKNLEIADWLKIQLLGITGSDVAIPDVLKALGNPDVELQEYAVVALGKIGAKTTIPSLLNRVEDPNSHSYESDLSHFLEEALGEIGSEEAVPTLCKLLEHSNEHVRSCAAGALGKIASKTAIPLLVKAIEDRDINVRASAVYALEGVLKA